MKAGTDPCVRIMETTLSLRERFSLAVSMLFWPRSGGTNHVPDPQLDRRGAAVIDACRRPIRCPIIKSWGSEAVQTGRCHASRLDEPEMSGARDHHRNRDQHGGMFFGRHAQFHRLPAAQRRHCRECDVPQRVRKYAWRRLLQHHEVIWRGPPSCDRQAAACAESTPFRSGDRDREDAPFAGRRRVRRTG